MSSMSLVFQVICYLCYISQCIARLLFSLRGTPSTSFGTAKSSSKLVFLFFFFFFFFFLIKVYCPQRELSDRYMYATS